MRYFLRTADALIIALKPTLYPANQINLRLALRYDAAALLKLLKPVKEQAYSRRVDRVSNYIG
jgi:hypothetical protein